MSDPVAKNIPALVVLHCSDTPDYPEGDPSFDRFGAEDVTRWHKERGFRTIGYHYVVRRSGVVEKGRPENEVGAHCLSRNKGSLGVCYVGRAKPTAAQLRAIQRLYYDFKERFGIQADDWKGHYEFNPAKTCPGIPMNAVRMMLDHDITFNA